MRTQPPFYRKIGGLHFFRLGRLQLSVCICRGAMVPSPLHPDDVRTIPAKVTARRAERTAIQYQFGPFA